MSNKIDYNLINSINKKADIVNIISKYIKLDKKGTSYVGICPFHPDTSPSLSVNPKLNFFKCFVCGTKGGPIEFVEKYCKIPFLDAVKIVAEASGTDITAFLNNSNNIYFNENIKRIIDANKHVNCIYQNLIYENKEAQDYLEKRKLDKSIVERFEIGYAPSDKKFIYYICTNHDDMFGKERSSDLLWNEKELIEAGIIIESNNDFQDLLINRITFPIYNNDGYLVGFSGRTIDKNSTTKYLNTPATKLFIKGDILYNYFKIPKDIEKLYICEGFMDVIAYVRAGIDNVVAIMGVALTKFQIDSLKELKNLKTIFLCFDNDTAGVNATYENGIKLLANGFNVYVVDEFENNIKDSDELINSKGKDGLIEAAQKYSDFIIFTIKNKLFKILPLDELKKNIEYIINLINLYGDQIFMSKYVDEIHKYTSLDKQDIIKKISFNNKNDKIISIQQNKYYKPHINEKNNNFIEEKEESVHSASKLSVISQEYHKVIEPLSKTINLLLSNLIRIMIANQNYVEIISHNISINIQGEDEEINDILKTIYYMHLKNIPITKESVHDKLLTINKKNSNSVIEKFNAITSMDTNIGKINKNLIITYIKKIADCRHNININLLLYMQSKDWEENKDNNKWKEYSDKVIDSRMKYLELVKRKYEN